MYARSRTHTDERHRSWLSQRGKLEARLLYRDSLAFLTAAAVVVLEKQQQPEVQRIEMIYHTFHNLQRVHCRICSRTCHGEPRTGIGVCGQQYHAVHSSRTRTHTHEPKRRNTVHGCHKGKSLKRGCCTVAAAAIYEKQNNTCGGDWGREKITCGGN